ncbi:MAG TPA: hypothetical protein VKT78_16890 [Fimbriimonadaceae bacterium]|nr:hypothetical protein [Fimbriimonadaceae bacterium]
MPQGAGAAAAAMPNQSFAGAYVPPPTKRWPWVVGSVLAGVLAIAGLHKVGLLRLAGGAPKSSLQANASAPPPILHQGANAPAPILQEPNQAPPPILQAPSAAPPPILNDSRNVVSMPKDIEDWLKWLEKIEKEKQELTSTESTKLTTLIATLQGASGLSASGVAGIADPDSNVTTAPGMDDAQKVAKEIVQEWAALKRKFDTYPPPKECVPIGTAFDNGLAGMSENANKLLEELGGIAAKAEPTQDDANQAIGHVKGVGRSHPHDIDTELKITDQLVQEICDKYDTRKWFSIDTHGGSGGLLGGLGGM